MSLNKLLFAITLILTSTAHVEAHEKKWPEKRLRQVWSSAQSFTSKQISLTSTQISKLTAEGIKVGSEDRSPIFYFAQEKSASSEKAKTIGIIVFVDEYGANGVMEVSVAMGEDGAVKKVDLWEHSEGPGVGKSEFLDQFVGKKANDSFVVNKDYRPAPDAPKASEAVAKAAQKALKISNIVFERK